MLSPLVKLLESTLKKAEVHTYFAVGFSVPLPLVLDFSNLLLENSALSLLLTGCQDTSRRQRLVPVLTASDTTGTPAGGDVSLGASSDFAPVPTSPSLRGSTGHDKG